MSQSRIENVENLKAGDRLVVREDRGFGGLHALRFHPAQVVRVTATQVRVAFGATSQVGVFVRIGRRAGEEFGKRPAFSRAWCALNVVDSIEEREHRLRVEVEALLGKVRGYLDTIAKSGAMPAEALRACEERLRAVLPVADHG